MGSIVRATLKGINPRVCSIQRNHHASMPRFFSTEAEQPPQAEQQPPPPPPQDSPQFFHTENSSLTYARLLGINRYALKTDIIHFLEGSNLTLEDVKVEYNRSYYPLAMMLQFPSYGAYDNAIRVNMRKGRMYKLERIDRGQWDIVTPYDGKTILIQGLPRNMNFADLERLLTGFEYDPTSFNVFLRAGDGTEPTRMATIRFSSRTQAMAAYMTKNGTYCMNNRILVQILQ